jgi:hypothetical protein
MKKSLLIISFAAMISTAVCEVTTSSGTGSLSFDGVMSSSLGTKFAITQRTGGRSNVWLEVGDKIGSYTITDYDHEAEIVTLVGSGKVVNLRLKSSSVRDSKGLKLDESEPSNIALGRTEAIASVRARMAARRERLKAKPTYSAYDESIPLKWNPTVRERNEKVRGDIEKSTRMVALPVELDGEPFIFTYKGWEFFADSDFRLVPELQKLTLEDKKALDREWAILAFEEISSNPVLLRNRAVAINKELQEIGFILAPTQRTKP